jgi:hypothetical protein
MKDFGKETLTVVAILFAIKMLASLIKTWLFNNVRDPAIVDVAEPALGAAFAVGVVYAYCSYSFPAFLAAMVIVHHGVKLYKVVATRKARAAMAQPSYCR